MLRIGGQKVPVPTLLLLASDCVLICLGLLIAIAIRFHDLDADLHYLSSQQTLLRFLFVVTACVVALYYNDLYNSDVLSRRTELLVRLLQALGTTCLALAFIYYIDPDLSLGRGITVIAAPAILLLTLSLRIVLNAKGLMLSQPERVLVLGTGSEGISLVREILARPELHMKVVGFLDEKGENIGKSLVNPGIIGAVRDVEEIARSKGVDRVILSLVERRGQTPVRPLLNLKFSGIGVEDAHKVHEALSGRIFIERLSPSWLILSDGFRKSPFLLAVKRCFDLLVSSIALIATLPVMLIVAAAIWFETGSPILYRQKRAGLHGEEFEMLKFRSMYQDAERYGPKWAGSDDERVTRVGRYIRKFRLDELPQVINVFRGEMSLVGPRPERPVFCRMLEEKIPFFVQRHSVRPGITGWAQIKYQYGASIEEAEIKLGYDFFYIKHLSLTLDLAILFETIKVVMYGRGAR
jgi:sugar transferase (PEP-CTERM system associated)